MKKEEFITRLAKKLEMTKIDTRIIVDTYEELIRESLLEGEEIKIGDVGKFMLVDVAERIGCHPRTQESITIPRHKKLRFKVYESFKIKIKQ